MLLIIDVIIILYNFPRPHPQRNMSRGVIFSNLLFLIPAAALRNDNELGTTETVREIPILILGTTNPSMPKPEIVF